MLLFVENEYEIGITVRSLGVFGVTRNYLNKSCVIVDYKQTHPSVTVFIFSVFVKNP